MEITILTATYNRGYLLGKVYNSLVKQKDKDFEWLIIDDGSTDDTAKIVASFPQNKFMINYIRKDNGGKHTALNYSHRYVKGKYVMVLDSDDLLADDAISIIKSYILQYDSDDKIGGFSFERGTFEGESYAGKSVKCDFVSNAIDYRINLNVKGDQAEVFKTEVFKKYIFPVFKNEKYVGEDYLHINMAYSYNMVYSNKIIRISDYRQDGLTAAGRKMLISNPLGGQIHGSLYFSKRFQLKYRVKGMMLYICYGLFAGQSIVNMYSNVGYKTLFGINLPLGILLYLYWRLKY